MKIHSTKAGHVIETDNKARPFRVCIGSRMRSFASIEAAVAAVQASLNEHRAQAVAEENAWKGA